MLLRITPAAKLSSQTSGPLNPLRLRAKAMEKSSVARMTTFTKTNMFLWKTAGIKKRALTT